MNDYQQFVLYIYKVLSPESSHLIEWEFFEKPYAIYIVEIYTRNVISPQFCTSLNLKGHVYGKRFRPT